MADEEPHSFDLVMPFVVVESAGGPYDDESFTAGYQCGFVDALLRARMHQVDQLAYASLVAQMDLIAMRNGYTLLVVEDSDAEFPEDWRLLRFRPGTGIAP